MEKLNTPVVDPTSGDELNALLSVEEISMSIKAMQSNNAPGPDGFPVELCKTFQVKLAPLLLNMFSESLESDTLTPTLNQVTITLILKSDKSPSFCNSYRPQS